MTEFQGEVSHKSESNARINDNPGPFIPFGGSDRESHEHMKGFDNHGPILNDHHSLPKLTLLEQEHHKMSPAELEKGVSQLRDVVTCNVGFGEGKTRNAVTELFSKAMKEDSLGELIAKFNASMNNSGYMLSEKADPVHHGHMLVRDVTLNYVNSWNHLNLPNNFPGDGDTVKPHIMISDPMPPRHV